MGSNTINENIKCSIQLIHVDVSFYQTGDQLKEGTGKLEGMLKHLEEEKISVEKTIRDCQNESEQLEEKIEKQRNQEAEAIVDDAIQAPAPLYKQ